MENSLKQFEGLDIALVMSMMGVKFPLPLFLWILKRYIWASFLYFIFCVTILFALTQWTTFFFIENFLSFAIFLFILGFIGSIGVFIFILFSFLKPLASSVTRIEDLAKSSSLENSKPNSIETLEEEEEDSPTEFYNLNHNLQLIYQNIQKKSLNLAVEQAELKAISAAVSDAIIAIDLDQKIIFSNPASQKSFLIKDIDQKQIHISEIVRSHDILDACKKCLTYGTPAQMEQVLTVGDYQQSRSFDISISPLAFHEKNIINGAVIIFRDITEVKNTKQSQSDFVSNVSHELKTPLTVISGFVETMLTDLESKNLTQMHHFLNIVNRNSQRLIALIDDLLSLSQLDSKSYLSKQEVSTKEVTSMICESINTENHKVHCNYKVSTVLASRSWLEQVLHNLITNAVRYTPKNSKIDIIWEKHPHFVLLTVKDDGEGIPLQHQSRIFERFYRVDKDRSREKGGTGIGLAIVKQVMEKHGGNVYLTSRRRGKGAQFTCAFPR